MLQSVFVYHSVPQELRGRKLLRTLRPVIPTTTTVDAYMHVDDVAAWLGDTPPTGLTTAAAPAADLSRLRLFSLNDYLGLSSHPDVCRAAAEAAMQVQCSRCAFTCMHEHPFCGRQRLACFVALEYFVAAS